MSVLVACGGGDTLAPPAAPSWAASGSYSPVLKVEGSASTTPIAIALSLVHPCRPDVEYVIDASAAPTALGLVWQKGSYDSISKQVAGLTPVASLLRRPAS